jgi:dolichyl-phosphate beta-glucosyltransferase
MRFLRREGLDPQKEVEPFLSLVVPVYNEGARLERNLSRIAAYLAARPYSSELIVVEDGSSDGTKALAAEKLRGVPRSRLISFPSNRGKGFCVREGVLASHGRFVGFMDADLSVPLETLEPALRLLESEYDAVVGSRLEKGAMIRTDSSRLRGVWRALFHRLRRGLVPSTIKDSQCGFKLFRREAARDVFSRSQIDGTMFDVEILAFLERSGRRVCELPVEWTHAPGSPLRFNRELFRLVRDLLSIRRRTA